MTKPLNIVKGILIVALSIMPVVLPAAGFAQDNNESVKQDAKDAGHSTKKAAKKTGHDVKKGTKKVVNKGAQKTGEASDKVQNKTQ